MVSLTVLVARLIAEVGERRQSVLASNNEVQLRMIYVTRQNWTQRMLPLRS